MRNHEKSNLCRGQGLRATIEVQTGRQEPQNAILSSLYYKVSRDNKKASYDNMTRL